MFAGGSRGPLDELAQSGNRDLFCSFAAVQDSRHLTLLQFQSKVICLQKAFLCVGFYRVNSCSSMDKPNSLVQHCSSLRPLSCVPITHQSPLPFSPPPPPRQTHISTHNLNSLASTLDATSVTTTSTKEVVDEETLFYHIPAVEVTRHYTLIPDWAVLLF